MVGVGTMGSRGRHMHGRSRVAVEAVLASTTDTLVASVECAAVRSRLDAKGIGSRNDEKESSSEARLADHLKCGCFPPGVQMDGE